MIDFASAVGGLNSTSPVPMLIFRYLANISSWVSTRDYFVQDLPHIISLLRDRITPFGAKLKLETPTQKNTLNALLTFLLNLGIGLNANARSSLTISSASARQILRKSIDQVSLGTLPWPSLLHHFALSVGRILPRSLSYRAWSCQTEWRCWNVGHLFGDCWADDEHTPAR